MKIIKVINCGNCPFIKWDWKSDMCNRKDNKRIKDIGNIPSWCPLEDYKS